MSVYFGIEILIFYVCKSWSYQNDKLGSIHVDKWLTLIMKEVNSNAILSYGQPKVKDLELPNVFLFLFFLIMLFF